MKLLPDSACACAAVICVSACSKAVLDIETISYCVSFFTFGTVPLYGRWITVFFPTRTGAASCAADVCVSGEFTPCESSPFLSQRRLSALNRPPFRSAKPHGRLPAPQGPLFCRSRHGCAAPGPRRQNPGAWIPVSHRSFRAPPPRSFPAPRHGCTSAGPGSAQTERLKRRLSVQPPGLKSLLRFPLFVLYGC